MGLLSFISFLSSIFPSPSSSSALPCLYLFLTLPFSIPIAECSPCFHLLTSFIHSLHWHVQNVMIPGCSQELLPFLSVIYLSFRLFLNLVVSKFIYNTLLEILLSSILCTCPNQRNLFNLLISLFHNVIHLYELSGRHTFCVVTPIHRVLGFQSLMK